MPACYFFYRLSKSIVHHTILATMASSRWKRFAFFDRSTLSLPSEVLEDLIPIAGSERRGSRRSVSALNQAAAESANDSVSLVVTTAALPIDSKPRDAIKKEEEPTAVSGMWSSLNACAAMELPGEESSSIRLPNQVGTFDEGAYGTSSGTAADGLVLCFVTSQETDHVHCFDLTVRCNPPDSAEKDLEDLDGWRGYFAPLKGRRIKAPQSVSSRNVEDRIIQEHMDQDTTEGIMGIATCRAAKGEVHMACISESNVVVCKDPHLYLSW
jgi:hypothetical protein